jgi:hypothetical protein
MNEKGYWKISYIITGDVENKIRAQSFNWGLRERAKMVVNWRESERFLGN